ncbi:peptidoglycan-binding protein [Pseudonocardia humida]|uniref:Peptidoglycan-binding protein n=1 Tax=Pseudonocardia humida TaxID=2800819 RepID=A0ABT1A0G3_9PSEU|nr:peptidoglycan-binding protein [Pseudonocardia humida]MCO1656490.1 peptidoglycan-binding protein [Pseudonocardia humida]
MTTRGRIGVGALAAVTVGLVALLVVGAGRGGAAPPAAAAPPDTATVVRTTLTETEEIEGTLGFGEARQVSARGPGTLTSVAAAGTVVHRGEALFAVDTEPVVLMLGAVPAYRDLRSGDEGADVAQLEENLAALGHTGFTVDDEFTSATATAVREWQEDLGVDETGRVELGRVVFAPADVRVSEVSAQVGDQVGGGPVLGVTGTARQVDMDVEVPDREIVAPGTAVEVELPGGTVVPGTIREVGAAAEQPPDDGQPGPSDPATVPVVVDVADPAAAAAFDQAPVTVTVTAGSAPDVLAVPVAALLALAEGGYGLEVVEGGAARVVAVQTGVFSDGKVEVSGAGIAEGAEVGVPAR